MGLTNALQIGRSGLLSSQAAIEVAGNNLANATTRGYHRQEINLAPIGDQAIGNNAFVGRGQQIQSITRQINEVLEQRIRDATSGHAETQVSRDFLLRIESIQNELSDSDLSSSLNAFFNAWSELAGAPNEAAQRNLAVQAGENLAAKIKDIRSALTDLQLQVDAEIGQSAEEVDSLLSQIEKVNLDIVAAERGNLSSAHSLRDERDQLMSELSEYLEISVIENSQGMYDVFVDSEPLMLNGRSRGIDLLQETVDGQTQLKLVLQDNGREILVDTGKLGGGLAAREEYILGAVGALDEFTSSLIYEVNKIHAQGQGAVNFSSVAGTYAIADATAALDSDAAGLAFDIQHGSFELNVTQQSTGLRESTTIDLDLDGIGGANTTLNDLIAQINAVDGVTATTTLDGRLSIAATSGDFSISFSDDSSGALAALGINTYFDGSNSLDVAVNSTLHNDSSLVATGQEHIAGDNRTALAIAALRSTGVDSAGGISLTEMWNRHVGDMATALSQQQTAFETEANVLANLSAQQQSISGVNVDEETINLMSYQRSYQASARFLNVVDELLQTLLNLL